ncbi:MAG: hypothetical protein ACYC1C_12240 [Chloroflexota bacterium]
MQPDDRDAAYLWDMREATRSILRFVVGETPSSFGALATASGRLTCAETLRHREFVISKLFRSA